MHERKRRIYYHDTDAGGIVYHANYLRFCEESRMELFLERGLNVADISKEHKCHFVTVHSVINWRAPAYLNEVITVKSKIGKINRSSMLLHHQIERDGKLLSEIDITLVCVSLGQNKATRLPDELRKALMP